MIDVQQRRAFLRAAVAAGIGWASADLWQVEEALAWAAAQAARESPPSLASLTAAQGRTLDAMTARLLPSVDGRPGAREAGALFFIDKALATFNVAQKRLYADGVADLERRAVQLAGRAATFPSLTAAQQDDVLRAIEASPFFQAVRFDTIVGTFALPTWGGNKDHAGWRLIGLEHLPRFQAPFGYYDADVNKRG